MKIRFVIKVFSFVLVGLFLSNQLLSQVDPKINPNGYNQFFYDDGTLASEGSMRDGKPDGYWKNYYEDGLLKSEGNRENFLLDSLWRFYDDEGKLILELSGEKLGSMMLKQGAVTIVTEVEIAENLPVHKFLDTLERYLKYQGCRAVRFTVWDGDDITLEMSGYRKTATGWNKIL